MADTQVVTPASPGKTTQPAKRSVPVLHPLARAVMSVLMAMKLRKFPIVGNKT